VALPRRGTRVFDRGAKRQTTWVGPALQGFVALAAATKIIVASFDPAANGLAKPTLVRTRGTVNVIPNVTTADVEFTGAIGVGVVTDRAFAAGAASIPGPFTDSGWDGWVATMLLSGALEFGTEGSFIWIEGVEVDSKAMRKVTDDETVVIMAESLLGTVRIDLPLRLLFKLA